MTHLAGKLKRVGGKVANEKKDQEKVAGVDLSERENKMRLVCVQLSPAIPEVKGPTNFICYWRIFVIANIEN